MRVHGLDIARFAAFVGMVLVNFRIVAEVAPEPGLTSFIIDHLEGRASALFVLLAGIGFSMGRPDTLKTLKRAGFLFVLGMVNMLIFPADILHYYALYFLVGILVLRLDMASLLMTGVALITGWMAMVLYLNYEAGWDWATLTYGDFWALTGFVRNSFFNGWHPVIPWAAFFVFGIAVGRLDLAARTIQRRLAIGGALLAMASSAFSGMAISAVPAYAEILGLSSIPPGAFYVLFSTGTALSALGIILLLTPMFDRLRLSNWFALAGRQTLTLYVAHILLGMGTLEAFGLLDGSLSTAQIFYISLFFCALMLVYVRLWALIATRGPLEWIMRKISG